MEGNGEDIDEWNYQLFEENIVNESFSNNNKRSIAQRRAEKCGLNASSISTPAMLPPPERETFLTIPPGLTPAALLDSPLMLPNTQTPQSPTTGSFQQLPTIINQEHSMSTHPLSFPSSSNTLSQSTYHFEFPAESPIATELKKCNSNLPLGTNSQENMSCIGLTNTSKAGNCSLRGVMNPNINNSNGSDDGYTWRKYGQKTVKGSEFPRSYYKCTQRNCLVKKKVERSPDGQITEIIYKGEHNHPKSQPPRRATTSSNSYDVSEKNEGNSDSSMWRNMEFEDNKDVRALSSREKTSSPSVSNSLMSNHQKSNTNVFISAETTPEPSSTLASYDDEDEDKASTSLGDDDDEFEHKRRRTEMCLSSRTTREPRVVVEIESEIDILDDGYRWRKYGQKVVKGNPNPRSYYKCTSAGCPVRKHVERAPNNLKSVMTTYEGKHNHQVPSTNKTNGDATASTIGSHSTSNGKSSTLTFPKNHKVEDHFHFQFERKPFEYVRPTTFLENQLISDLRCGVASPIYNVRFPPNLQNPLSYNNSLLFSPTQISTSLLQRPHFSLPLNFPMVPPLGGFHGVSSVAIGDQNHIYENNDDKNLKLFKANEDIKMEHHLRYSSEML